MMYALPVSTQSPDRPAELRSPGGLRPSFSTDQPLLYHRKIHMTERGVSTFAGSFQHQPLRHIGDWHRSASLAERCQKLRIQPPCFSTLRSTCSLIRMSNPQEHQVNGIFDIVHPVAEIGHLVSDN